MIRRIFLLLIVLVGLMQQHLHAAHVLGGEISYKCLGNGMYEFTVIIFRDCAGPPLNIGSVSLQGPVAGNLPLISSADVSPRCSTSTAVSCLPPQSGSGQQGAVSRFIYRGNLNLSGLGPAPAMGYTWFVSSSIPCCRPTNNNSASTFGTQALQVKMYPYTNPATGTVMTPAQICDKSPEFIDNPTATMILNPNDTIYYQNFALDPDLEDSTTFGIDFPLSGALAPFAYNPPYSLANPLPGIVGPPFVAAANTPINPVSGEMVLRPITTGTFVTVIKVSSYRCGQLISEVFRDFSLKVIPNPVGSPPPFNPNALSPNNLFMQRAPIIFPPFLDASNRPIYELTYYAKDIIDIPFNVIDIYPALSGNPADPTTWMPAPTGFTVVFNGNNLSPTNNPANCPNGFAPCATIRGATDPGPPAPVATPPSTILNGNGTVAGIGYSTIATQGGARFVWIPDCSNLPINAVTACGVSVTGYQFSVTATDFNCPVVGRDVRVFTFNVQNLPRLESPKFFGVSADGPSNNQATLHFRLDIDTTSIDSLDNVNFANEPASDRLARSVNRRKQSFEKYYVYRSTSAAGPYTRIDSIPLLETFSYTDATLNLNANQYYYYLTTISSCGGFESAPSDTLKVIHLNVSNNVAMGSAELSWDSTARAMGRNYPANATGAYQIEMEVYSSNPGVWLAIDTVQDLYEYVQGVVVCNDSVNYRVGLFDTSGLIYYSRVAGDLFNDVFPPDSVVIHHVSVDSLTGFPVLSWQPGPSLDVIKYIVYRIDIYSNPVVAIPIDTIIGFNSVYWLDTVSGQNPYDSSLHYGIAGVDSCGNTGLISRRHSTIHLSGGLDQCISSIVLQWTDYKGWDAVQEYEIWRSDAGAPYVSLATIPSGQEVYQYVDNQNLIQDTTYCYTIVAKRAVDDTIAWSNHICAVASIIEPPQYSYIRKVTVDTLTQLINVLFTIDTAADAGSFEIYRATASTDFRLVHSFIPAMMTRQGGSLLYNYVDITAETEKEAYFYQVRVYDLCDQQLDTSNVSNSIFVQGVPEVDFTNRLRWNNYRRWLGGVDQYEILRYIPNFDPGFIPINQVGANSVVFNDDIRNFADNDGLYTYIIKAIEGSGNPLGVRDTAYSNRTEVIQQPRIFMPTAFVPQGVTRILQPKGVFIEEQAGFRFEVYNRWGELIFMSQDMELGWNGTQMNGQLVQPGVYPYIINFIGKNGKPYSQHGTVTVIR